MAYPAVKMCDEGSQSLSAKTPGPLNERVPRERRSREDRVSAWCVSIMMGMVFLILILFLIQVIFSGPKNRHPTESAWYRYPLPLFKILSWDRSVAVHPLSHRMLQGEPTKTFRGRVEEGVTRRGGDGPIST